MRDEPSLAERAAGLLGARLARARPIAGGDLSEVVAIDLDDGREAVVKSGPAPAIEAGMLEAIATTGAPVPAVLACDDAVLVLERLPNQGRIDDAWRDLGAALAKLHAPRRDGGTPPAAPEYGWPVDYAFGKVAIENARTDTWPEFWAERRLANQLAYLPPAVAARLESLAADLANRLPAEPPAALLHGDLWGGNILADAGRISGLVDPACYCGHAEVDFAMLRLFGQPGREFLDAYGTLAPGCEQRLPIYQLWPALVHLRLFGSAYRSMVERMLSEAGV
jgi:fructosamine-3-kinase